jgi:hypothetical protein
MESIEPWVAPYGRAFFDLIASRSVLERRKNTRPACVRIFILFYPLRIYDLGDVCLTRFCSTLQRIFLPRCSISCPSCRSGYIAIFVGREGKRRNLPPKEGKGR